MIALVLALLLAPGRARGRGPAGLRRGPLRGRRALLRRPWRRADLRGLCAGPGERPARAPAEAARPSTARSPSIRRAPRPGSSAAGCASSRSSYDEAVRRPARGASAPRGRLRARPAGLVAAPRRPQRRGPRRLESRSGGRPRLASRSSGLVHTRDRSRAASWRCAEGEVLDLGHVRESRLRPAGAGGLRPRHAAPRPRGGGRRRPGGGADASARPRRGAGGARGGTGGERRSTSGVRLRYANVAGTGVSVGGQYRWEENRPDLSFAVDWPRPLGLAADSTCRPSGPPGLRRWASRSGASPAGSTSSLRRVLGARTVARARAPDARPIVLAARRRTRARATSSASRRGSSGASSTRTAIGSTRRIRLFRRAAALGSDLAFPRGGLRGARYRGFLAPPDATADRALGPRRPDLVGAGGARTCRRRDVRPGRQPRHGAAAPGAIARRARARSGRRPSGGR